MAAAASTTFTDRVVGALRLDASVYEEIEADKTATLQAAVVVVLGSIAAGIGSGVRLGFVGLFVVTVAALASWSLYAWITYWLGTGPLRGPSTKADWGEVARTLGFANSPRLLLVLGAIGLDLFVVPIVAVWLLSTTIVALREALDVTTARASVVAILGWIVEILVRAVVIFLQAG